MIKAVARRLFGSVNDRVVKAHMRKAARIGALEPDLKALSDSDIKARTGVLKERAANGESLDDLLIDAFATVRERRGAPWASVTSTSSSSAAWCCTKAASPR